MFLYGYPHNGLRERAEHKVVLKFPVDLDANKHVEQYIQPWMDENLNDDCWCEVTWRTEHVLNGNGEIICTAVGINITLHFSDLSDAALFRLRF